MFRPTTDFIIHIYTFLSFVSASSLNFSFPWTDVDSHFQFPSDL